MEKQYETARQAPHESLFIPSEKLGVLEAILRAGLAEETKRKRSNRVRELAGLMAKLGLVPHAAQVRAIGLGCDTAGAHGALVLLEPLTRCLPAGPIGNPHSPQGEAEVPQ